jgi:hypothetical protein
LHNTQHIYVYIISHNADITIEVCNAYELFSVRNGYMCTFAVLDRWYLPNIYVYNSMHTQYNISGALMFQGMVILLLRAIGYLSIDHSYRIHFSGGHLNCNALTFPIRSTCPALYCSKTSLTSYGFNASLNLRRANKYFIYKVSYILCNCINLYINISTTLVIERILL